MGENAELQEEELEVLKSIYEGDPLYRFAIEIFSFLFLFWNFC